MCMHKQDLWYYNQLRSTANRGQTYTGVMWKLEASSAVRMDFSEK